MLEGKFTYLPSYPKWKVVTGNPLDAVSILVYPAVEPSWGRQSADGGKRNGVLWLGCSFLKAWQALRARRWEGTEWGHLKS